MHPLDPLSADEIRQAVAILRRDRDVGPSWRFASISSRSRRRRGCRRGTAARSRGGRGRDWNRRDGAAYRAARRPRPADSVTEFAEELPGVQPNFTVDEWHECDEMLRAASRRGRGARAARGITDIVAGAGRHVGLRRGAGPRAVRGPPDRLVRRLGAGDAPGANPYAHPVTGLHLRRRPEHDGAARDRGRRAASPAADVMGEYVPEPACPGCELRDDSSRWRSRQPEGVVVHPRRQRAVAGRTGDAAGLQLPRGPGPAPGRLRRRRPASADRAPAVVRRDGGARTATRRRTTTGAPRSTSASGAWAS